MGTVRPHTMPEGGKISLEWLRAGDLHVDPIYERPCNEPKVVKIMAAFDPDAIGVLEVSRRDDDSLWIMDGQHRHQAILREWGPAEKLPCNVHHGLTIQDEARIYGTLNRDRTKPNPLNLHRAAVASGEPVAVDVDRIAHRHGYRVTYGPGPGNVQAVGAMYDVYRKGSPQILDAALSLIRSAGWDESPPAEMIVGVALLVARHGNRIDSARFRKMLQDLVPRQVLAQARVLKSEVQSERTTLGTTVAQILLNRYNRGRRSGRIDWAEGKGGQSFWRSVDGPEAA